MSAYSEEQRVFINNMKLEGKTIPEIQTAFKEKFDRTPAPVTINKYGRYHLWARDRDEIPDEGETVVKPKEKEKEGGALEIEVKDTRKEKKPKDEVVHFSDGELDEAQFNRIVALRGTSQQETWEFLRKCGEKGFTKINMKTGEISE